MRTMFACALAGVLVALSAGVGEAQENQVNVGVTTASSDAGIFIAYERGYFTEAGIEVTLTPFSTALPMMAAVATGEVDVARSAQSAGLFNGFARGIEFKMVADGGSLSKGGGYLALSVRKDLADSGAIKSAADLKGKRIAIAGEGGTSDIALDHYLQTASLSLKDVQRVSISIPDQIAAFTNKSIDAAITLEPIMTAMVDRGIAVRFAGGDEMYPNMQAGILTYSSGFAARTDLATRFMVAYLKGTRDYNDAFFKRKDVPGVIGALVKHTSIKDAALYAKIVPAGLDPNGAINIQGLRDDLDWYRRNGFSEAQIDVDKFVDTSFAKAAVKQLGPYSD